MFTGRVFLYLYSMAKNIVITGTSRGIGYELVALLADTKNNILALSRNAVPVSGMGITNCHCFPCDITDGKDIKKAAQFVQESWGKVDVLINNSGYLVNCLLYTSDAADD